MNISEKIMLIEEIKDELLWPTDEEAEKMVNNYKSNIFRVLESPIDDNFKGLGHIELADYCRYIDSVYQLLLSKGLKEEEVRKTAVTSGKYFLKMNRNKEIILNYLGKEIEEYVYLHRPNALMHSDQVLYARYAFITDYNKTAKISGKKVYSIGSVDDGTKMDKIFHTTDRELVALYPIPNDLKLEIRYPDDPKKRQFIKNMCARRAIREQENNK